MVQMKVGRDTGKWEIVWVIYGQRGESREESRAQLSRSFPSSLLAEASKNGSEERWLGLQTDHCYGATCVPASIDEWSKCIIIVDAIILKLVQPRQQL